MLDQEVEKPGNEIHRSDIDERHPGGIACVITRDQREVGGPGSGWDADRLGVEVEDHEVKVGTYSFDPPDQPATGDDQAGFLGDFTNHRFGHPLPRIDTAAGHGPPALSRRVDSCHEEDVVGDDHDGTDRQRRLGAGGQRRLSRSGHGWPWRADQDPSSER